MHLTPEQSLALALDPALLFDTLSLAPDPWQTEVLRSNHRRVLLNCCGQAGKSTTVAALALHTALRSDDSALVAASVAELSQYDTWVAHNGARSDAPFLRTRLAKWGLDPLPSKKLGNPVQLARNKLRMSFNSLAAIANFLGFNSKTEVKGDLWLAAALDGSTVALDYIVEHGVRDVLVLEKVLGVLKGYSTQFNTWGSGF